MAVLLRQFNNVCSVIFAGEVEEDRVDIAVGLLLQCRQQRVGVSKRIFAAVVCFVEKSVRDEDDKFGVGVRTSTVRKHLVDSNIDTLV
jgi:hypothetical protein